MKNKRIDIRIDPETEKLLKSLCLRYNNTKSEIIRKALKTMASKTKHYITIGYYDAEPDKKEEINKEDMQAAIKIAQVKWVNK